MILPTSYFPSILYFKYLVKYKSISICSEELYLKQTFRNRCEILGSNGIHKLSIPVERTMGSKSKTKEVLISNVQNWRKDHWGAIESSYRTAPYFHFYDKEIKELLDNTSDSLIDFNQTIINQFISWWDLPIDFIEKQDCLYNESINFLSRKKNLDYIQVFEDKLPFVSNLSVLDLLFCEGPMGRKWFLK